MANLRDRNLLKFYVYIIAALVFFNFLLVLFSEHEQLVEKIYGNNIYNWLCLIQHFFFSLFPFSIGDILYIGIVLLLIYLVFLLIKLLIYKKLKQFFIVTLRLIIGVLAFFLLFYFLWGLNYFRLPASKRLNLVSYNFTTEELKNVTAILIDSANVCRTRLNNTDWQQSNQQIYSTSVLAIKKLGGQSTEFKSYSPGVKSSILTGLLNYMGTAGYFNPFTGEAQVNYEMPIFERPVVACHEMSHQMGFGAEDEANYVGFLAATGSDDRLSRYSAYHLAVDEFMHALYARDSLSFKELKPRISKAVKSDFLKERLYWYSFQNNLDNLTGLFYDNFLKANNQPQGIKTYNRMVLLLMAQLKNKK